MRSVSIDGTTRNTGHGGQIDVRPEDGRSDRRVAALAGSRRLPSAERQRSGRAGLEVVPPGGLAPAGDGSMWVHPGFRVPLRTAGLVDLDSVMATRDGDCLRALPDRENWRLKLEVPGHGGRCVFLKKHHVRTRRTRRLARRGLGPDGSAGRTEAQRTYELSALGIGVAPLVAWGEKLHPDGRLESFVMTEELWGHTALDLYLADRFPPRGGGPRRDRALDRLVGDVATVARRFHQAGYNHRDFYCGHFFVLERKPGRFQVRLIDLQRVQYRRRFRRRWIVKDLAQLAWSAAADRIGCTQKMAFMRHYLGVRKLRPRDKRLIREILAKQQAMTQRLGIGP